MLSTMAQVSGDVKSTFDYETENSTITYATWRTFYYKSYYRYFIGVKDQYILYTIPFMALASLLTTGHFLKRKRSSQENTNLPDPEIILLGVYVHCTTIAKCIYAIDELFDKCFQSQDKAMGFWLVFLVVSIILTCILSSVKSVIHKRFNLLRSLFTFVGSFVINFSTGLTGDWLSNRYQSPMGTLCH